MPNLDPTLQEKEDKIMLCPLRHEVNSAAFEDCYEDKCVWWVGSPKDRFGGCSITFIGWVAAQRMEDNFFISLTDEEKAEEMKKIKVHKEGKHAKP